MTVLPQPTRRSDQAVLAPPRPRAYASTQRRRTRQTLPARPTAPCTVTVMHTPSLHIRHTQQQQPMAWATIELPRWSHRTRRHIRKATRRTHTHRASLVTRQHRYTYSSSNTHILGWLVRPFGRIRFQHTCQWVVCTARPVLMADCRLRMAAHSGARRVGRGGSGPASALRTGSRRCLPR